MGSDRVVNNIDHSFDKVYRELRQQVLALGLRLTGRSDEAEDVMQETFLLVHRYLPRFRGEAKVSTWVYRIATRVALEHRKRKQKADQASHGDTQVADLPGPESQDQVQSREEVGRIHSAMRSLSPAQSAVLSLLAIEGLAPPEVAEILGIPEGTVWSRASQARRLLRAKLDPPDHETQG